MDTDSVSSSDFEDDLEQVPDWPFDSCTLILSDGRSLDLADSISQSTHNGQSVYVCRGKLGWDGIVVKWTWSDARMHDLQVVESAANFARECGDNWVFDHLPNIMHYEERVTGTGARGEPRIMHLLVQEELYSIAELTTAGELGEAFLGLFNCYRWLYERCRIMHRNINFNNLMYRRIDDRVYGVLAGFDLAVILNEPSYKPHPENTLAFVACDLVEPSPLFPVDQYLYRFDLESLLYALVLVTCHYEHGMLIPPEKQPFKCWHQVGSTDRDMFLEKIHFLTGGLGRWKPTPQFSSLFWLVAHLRELFKHGISARDKFRYRKEVETGVVSDDGFDGDTLGGHVTFDTFEAVLRTKLPPSKSGRASAEP
ncbi:other 1 protein kinase [Favolaschia claudopus]|uniref:Other 1 protein kinase n=1 Tax=Favolaschia claudopus TaxID=2862362 RepID=A0AAW0BQX5_9AGAR